MLTGVSVLKVFVVFCYALLLELDWDLCRCVIAFLGTAFILLLWLVFRNILLSHHDYFPRPQRWLTWFSRVFLQLIMYKTCQSAFRAVKTS